MRLSVRAGALAAATLLAIAAAPAVDLSALTVAEGPDGDDPHVASESMSWVANLQYEVTDNNSQSGTTDVQGGTDLELTTLRVPDGADGFDDIDVSVNGTY